MSSVVEILKKKSSSSLVVLGSVLLGIAFGMWWPKLAVSSVIISDIYVDMLKMVSMPFMISAVVYSLSNLIKGGGALGIISRVLKLLFYFMTGCALIGLLAAFLMGPGRGLSQETLLMLSNLVGQNINRESEIEMPLFAPLLVNNPMSIKQMLLGIIPSNIFQALTNGDALQILIFSLIFGIVVGRMKPAVSIPLTDALNGVFNACLKLTIWLNYLVPPVLVTMVAYQVATSGIAPLRAMLGFLLTLGASGLAVLAISFILLRWSTGLPWREVVDSQRESLIMAVATRSSPACMPIMINTLVNRLGLPKERVELLVPLGISLLRLGPVLNYTVATLFIAQMFGKELQVMEWIFVAIGGVLMGMASSGMSGIATISLTGTVCSFIGIPFSSLLVLFVAIDPLCNTIRIVVSIAGTNAFTALACKETKRHEAVDATPVNPNYRVAEEY